MARIDLEKPLLDKNDRAARANRELFDEKGIFVIDLLSSPGSGKTTTIQMIIRELGADYKVAVIEGDIASSVDADKIAAYAKDAVSWCVAVGLINGKSGGVLDPTGNATRAEIAKVLTSFDGYVRREVLTAPDHWEDDILIPDVVPDIDREDPLYLYAREIFDAINVKRTQAGLKGFIWSDRVYLAARTRAKEISDLAEHFNHTRPDGSYFATALTEAGVNATVRNEIIAHGYTTSKALVDKWTESNTTSPVINAVVYSQAAIGVFQAEPEEEGAQGKYFYALLVIG